MLAQIDHRDWIAKTRRSVRTHAALAADYARVGAWLTRDYFRVVRWRLLQVIASGAAHIAMKFAAMGVIYLCVRALTDELPASLPGIELISPKSPEFVVLSVGVGVALLIATSVFRYDVRRRAIRLGRKYEEYCARRIILLASRLPDSRVGLASQILQGDGMHQYPGYGRFCGMVARQLTALLPTFASFVAVSVALLWMDLWLTITLAALALAALVAQYPANHRAATASRIWERTRRESGRRYMSLFRHLVRDPIPLASNSPIVDGLFRSGHVRENMDSFSARAMSVEDAALVSRIASAVLLGATLVLLGVDIVEGERSWEGVAVFVAAVKFALSDFVSVCKIASSLTKFHAQIAHYRDFVVGAIPCLREAPGAPPAIAWPLELRLPGLHDPDARLALRPGDLLALFVPGRGRMLLPTLFDEVVERQAGQGFMGPVVIDSEVLAPEVELRTSFGLPRNLSEAAVEKELARFAPDGEGGLAFATSGWLGRTPGAAAALPEWALLALHVIAMRERQRPLVAMFGNRYAAMAKRWQAACRDALASSVLLLVHSRPFFIGQCGEPAVIICDDEKLQSWLPLGDRRSTAVLTETCRRLIGQPTQSTLLDEDELVD